MTTALESRIAEVLMGALSPCDLGDSIEVVHDVETIEIEMDCDLADPPVADDDGTSHFVRFSAPYERIEIQLDRGAYLRATIEDARRLSTQQGLTQ